MFALMCSATVRGFAVLTIFSHSWKLCNRFHGIDYT